VSDILKTKIARRSLLRASALTAAGAGATIFGPWKYNRVWAAGNKPIVIGLTHDASGQFANSGQAEKRGTIMIMLVRQHALELAPHKILVNGVAPTYVVTEMIREAMRNPETRDKLIASIPLGRLAETTDIVGPTLFLASPASDFITGQVLYVDGGITANR